MLDWYCGIVMLPYAVLFVISHYSMKRWNKNPLDLWPRVEQRKLVLEEKKHTQSKTESPKNQLDRKSHQKNQKNKKKQTKPAFSSVFVFCFAFFVKPYIHSLCCWTHNIGHGAYNCHWRLTVQPNQVKQVYVMETRWMLAKCCTSW